MRAQPGRAVLPDLKCVALDAPIRAQEGRLLALLGRLLVRRYITLHPEAENALGKIAYDEYGNSGKSTVAQK